MDAKLRRTLGAHYTSEKSILKVIKPLFLDELRAEFEKAKNSERKLFDLLKKLSNLRFLDPACGCGNFLVIAYRELRLLELDILLAMQKLKKTGALDFEILKWVQVNVDQFYGIEIEEFPREIAQVAMWLTDHQMNMRVSVEFGQPFIRLPLTHAATIKHANALRIDWNDVISAERVDYILGNPPFVGKQFQSDEQKKDMAAIFNGVRGAGVVDYVAAWYVKAVRYVRGEDSVQSLLDGFGEGIAPKDRVKIAFVSTNSITQGEQVSVLWGELLRLGVKIHFAHRTFQWSNEARGMAAVHCVVIGFALFDASSKIIFEYSDIRGEPQAIQAVNVNPIWSTRRTS